MKTPEQKEILSAFKFLEENISHLRGNATYFIASLRKYYRKNKCLSEKQQKGLLEIVDNIKAEVSC